MLRALGGSDGAGFGDAAEPTDILRDARGQRSPRWGPGRGVDAEARCLQGSVCKLMVLVLYTDPLNRMRIAHYRVGRLCVLVRVYSAGDLA